MCNLPFLVFYIDIFLDISFVLYWYWFYFMNIKPRNFEIALGYINRKSDPVCNNGKVYNHLFSHKWTEPLPGMSPAFWINGFQRHPSQCHVRRHSDEYYSSSFSYYNYLGFSYHVFGKALQRALYMFYVNTM